MVRIAVTGGSGKAGRHVIPFLLKQGHKVVNIDQAPFPKDAESVPADCPEVFTIKTDLTNSGEVFNAFTSNFGFDDYDIPREGAEPQPIKPDVIFHLGAWARNLLVPDNRTFADNTQSTYNVIEAACKLGIKKIIISSSETTYGVCFAQGPLDYDSFPVEEDDYDVNPMDTYALSKLCGERTARSFARRFPGTDIIALRIGNVIEPHEYKPLFRKFLVEGMPSRKGNMWSYIDARDLGNICNCIVNTPNLGFQIFNATNSFVTSLDDTETTLKKWAPNTPIKRELEKDEAPLSNKKIQRMIGFKDLHDWRKEIGGEEVIQQLREKRDQLQK